ncbi:MAG TPA: YdeI/OmpD-associated family protein [Myxococcaceae bacterium]|nr:YdeI/OmpD-associated family protein [Myxococcaceae bacterium]
MRRSGHSRGRRPAGRSSTTGRGKSAAGPERRQPRRGAGGTSGKTGTSGERKRFAGDALERLALTDRASWRAWLEEHHARVAGVWLVSFKKATGKPRVEYEHAVEEALCFGWIDSLERTLDEKRAMQLFTPRKPRSPWSTSNKIRVERLVAAGLMRPAGLAKIEQARHDGSWDAYAVAESLELPPDLRAAFESGPPGARSSWDAFSPSSRRAILWWVHSAKRPETRAQRIAQVVSEAARGRRANFPEDRA